METIHLTILTSWLASVGSVDRKGNVPSFILIVIVPFLVSSEGYAVDPRLLQPHSVAREGALTGIASVWLFVIIVIVIMFSKGRLTSLTHHHLSPTVCRVFAGSFWMLVTVNWRRWKRVTRPHSTCHRWGRAEGRRTPSTTSQEHCCQSFSPYPHPPVFCCTRSFHTLSFFQHSSGHSLRRRWWWRVRENGHTQCRRPHWGNGESGRRYRGCDCMLPFPVCGCESFILYPHLLDCRRWRRVFWLCSLPLSRLSLLKCPVRWVDYIVMSLSLNSCSVRMLGRVVCFTQLLAF